MLYDCIIIGAGPAGLMAARHLKGKNFLVIDGKQKIGKLLHCGEGVRQQEFRQLFGRLGKPIVANAVRYQEVMGKKYSRKFPISFLQLNRPEFEKWLAKPVKDKIRLNCFCTDIRIHEQYVEVFCSGKTLKSKTVILAHGPSYSMQKRLGLIRNEPQFVIGYGGIFDYRSVRPDTFHYLFDDNNFGYLWLFPKSKKSANIGFAGLNVKNPKAVLPELLKKFGITAKQKSEYSGLIPISGPIDRTYSDRILVAGTAAGLVCAGTGEGVYYALASGKMAAETINKALHRQIFGSAMMREYEQRWKRELDKSMKAGIIFRDLLYFAFKTHRMAWLIRQPSDHELKEMLLGGKTPRRALIAWNIIRAFGFCPR